jgi:hypothetical protein
MQIAAQTSGSPALLRLCRYSNHVNLRDKTIKVAQYGCRFFASYYSSLPQKNIELLGDLSFMCSMGRKLFRVFKSINCLELLVSKLRRVPTSITTVKEVAFILEMLEHVFLTLFYYYDNVLLLGRSKILPNYDSRLWDLRTYSAWSLHDITAFIRKLLLLYDCVVDEQREGRILDSTTSPARTGSIVQQRRQATMRVLAKKRVRLLWGIFKSMCDLCVSCSMFTNLRSGERRVSDTAIGLCGTASAIIAISDSMEECDLAS